MKKDVSKRASTWQATHSAELEALADLPDNRINTTQLPEQRDWSRALRGLFYRRVKQQFTLRLDADLVAWFRARSPEGKGYQTGINAALRDYVTQHTHEERRAKTQDRRKEEIAR